MFSISLEEKTGQHYAELRKKYLKSAKEYYSRELWKEPYFKALAFTGMGIGIAGTALGSVFEHPLFLAPAGAGIINMIQAYVKNKTATKAIVGTLEAKTEDMTYDELEKRLNDKNYELPEFTDEDLQQMEMEMYASNIVETVKEKELSIGKYPWTALGLGLMVYGGYKSCTESPMAGGFTMMFGGIITLVADVFKRKKLKSLREKVMKTLEEKGYQHFDNYLRKKKPEDFYKYDVLKSKE